MAAIQRGRWQAAAELFEQVLALRPGHPRSLYNLACCRSRLGNQEAAAEALEAAWQAGLHDITLLSTDPDLEGLRTTRKGKRLITRLIEEEQNRRRLRGTPLLFEAPMVAGARVVTPKTIEPGRRYPLVVVLHGHGGSNDRMAGLFTAAGLSPDVIVCAPSAPHPVWLNNGQGFSWYPPATLYNEILAARREADPSLSLQQARAAVERLEQDAAERYVLSAIDAVSRDYPVDPERTFVVGHSEGGVLAYGLALSAPNRFRGLVVIGTRLRAADAAPERLEQAAGQLRVLICHSPDDEAMAFTEGRSAYRTLKGAGIDTSFERYAGGHGLTVELIRRIAGWIDRAARKESGGVMY